MNTYDERLEFLGDRVLSLVISQELYEMYPEADEGYLSRICGYLVSTDYLSALIPGLDADEFEVEVAKIYLAGGVGKAREFINKAYGNFFNNLTPESLEQFDPKTALQQLTQSKWGVLPVYQTTQLGPAHAPEFRTSLYIEGDYYGTSLGKTKKAAEKNVARNALRLIKENP